jgi:flagellar biosynthetic protein FliQ
MNLGDAILIGQEALQAIAMISGPLLVGAMAVGLVISLLQAVTQVHEMTLVFVPKMLAVFIMMLALGGWMLEHAVNFGIASFSSIAYIEQ